MFSLMRPSPAIKCASSNSSSYVEQLGAEAAEFIIESASALRRALEHEPIP